METLELIMKEISTYFHTHLQYISKRCVDNIEEQDRTIRVVSLTCTSVVDASSIVKNKVDSIIENCIIEGLKNRTIRIQNIEWDDSEEKTSDNVYELRYEFILYKDGAILPMITYTKIKLIAKYIERHISTLDIDSRHCVISGDLSKSLDDAVKYRGIINMSLVLNLTEYSNILNDIIQDLYECNIRVNIDYELDVNDVWIDFVYGANIFIGLCVRMCFK